MRKVLSLENSLEASTTNLNRWILFLFLLLLLLFVAQRKPPSTKITPVRWYKCESIFTVSRCFCFLPHARGLNISLSATWRRLTHSRLRGRTLAKISDWTWIICSFPDLSQERICRGTSQQLSEILETIKILRHTHERKIMSLSARTQSRKLNAVNIYLISISMKQQLLFTDIPRRDNSEERLKTFHGSKEKSYCLKHTKRLTFRVWAPSKAQLCKHAIVWLLFFHETTHQKTMPSDSLHAKKYCKLKVKEHEQRNTVKVVFKNF